MSSPATKAAPSARLLNRMLNGIERLGNRLPDPFMIFVYLGLVVILTSVLMSAFDASVVHPSSGDTLEIRSLLSGEGLRFIFGSMLTNFTGFAPLGLVLAMMLGIGLAEKLGMLEVLMRRTVLNAPRAIVTYVIALTAMLGNLASDAAMVLLPPLAAMVFHAIGRHPIAGLTLGFGTAGAGFTANFLIVGTDALLSGISTAAAQIIEPGFIVTPVDNWYFNSLSVVVLTIVAAQINDRLIEPRLGEYRGEATQVDYQEPPHAGRALRNAGITAVCYIAALVTLVAWPGSPMRNEEGGLLPSPFLSSIIPFILLFFIATSVAYGKTTGQIKSAHDVVAKMTEAIRDLAGYIVLIFAAAQFIAYFSWSHIGTWVAIHGAEVLTEIGFTGLPVILSFILLTSMLNLLITSGSAMWALMAPVSIPMLMQLGYHPGFIQMAYRVGDSSTNIISPLNPYVMVVLGFMRRYDPDAGLGTLIALMLPYAISFLIVWMLMLSAFVLLDLPFGPGIFPML